MKHRKNKLAPFDIPGINNKLEALAIHLGLDSDNDEHIKTVEVLDKDEPYYREIHRFMHNGNMYHVSSLGRSRLSKGFECDAAVQFNSNIWAIKQVS